MAKTEKCEWPRAVEKKKIVPRDLDTVGEKPPGGLLAHIIDSRVAARDAPALLCPVERWQEAWFRDNSFLIACLIHTTSNYNAVPRATAPFSKSFRETSVHRLLSSDGQSRRFIVSTFPKRLLCDGRFVPVTLQHGERN